jgi:hypothetical protein
MSIIFLWIKRLASLEELRLLSGTLKSSMEVHEDKEMLFQKKDKNFLTDGRQ